MYSVIFVRYSPLLFFSLFLFFVVFFFAKISTGGLGRGRTGPTRAAIETRDETRGSTGECHVNVCSPLYLFLLPTLLFSIVYITTTGGAGRGRTGPMRAAIETRDETVGQRVRDML